MQATALTAVSAGDSTTNAGIFLFIPNVLISLINLVMVGDATFRSMTLDWQLPIRYFTNLERVRRLRQENLEIFGF